MKKLWFTVALCGFVTVGHAAPPEDLSAGDARAMINGTMQLPDSDGTSWKLVTFREQGIPGQGWHFNAEHALSVLAREDVTVKRGGRYQEGNADVHYSITSTYDTDTNRDMAEKMFEATAEVIFERVQPMPLKSARNGSN